MLKKQLIFREQEREGDYLFENVSAFITADFFRKFGDEALELVGISLCTILEMYENPDYLQVFFYGGVEYYVISDFRKGARLEDYENLDEFYVTFLLAEEY